MDLRKMIIVNIMITSSLMALTLFLLKYLDKGIEKYITGSEFVGNGSQFHFYSKEEPAAVNTDMLCRNIETHRMKEVSVWKTPLKATKVLPTDMDALFHAYIVYETEDPMGVKHYWSQEKLTDTLVTQHSTKKEDVIRKMSGQPRLEEGDWVTDPELLLQESSAFGAVPQYVGLS